MSNRPHDASTFKYKFLFLFKKIKDQKSESGEASKSLAGLESIYKTWQRKHCSLPPSAFWHRETLLTATFSYIRKSTN